MYIYIHIYTTGVYVYCVRMCVCVYMSENVRECVRAWLGVYMCVGACGCVYGLVGCWSFIS